MLVPEMLIPFPVFQVLLSWITFSSSCREGALYG